MLVGLVGSVPPALVLFTFSDRHTIDASESILIRSDSSSTGRGRASRESARVPLLDESTASLSAANLFAASAAGARGGASSRTATLPPPLPPPPRPPAVIMSSPPRPPAVITSSSSSHLTAAISHEPGHPGTSPRSPISPASLTGSSPASGIAHSIAHSAANGIAHSAAYGTANGIAHSTAYGTAYGTINGGRAAPDVPRCLWFRREHIPALVAGADTFQFLGSGMTVSAR